MTLSLNLNATSSGGATTGTPSPRHPTVSSTTTTSAAASGDDQSASATVAKLINLDSPDSNGVTSTTDADSNPAGKSESVCVTHFSPTGDGSGGVERETLFSDAIATMLGKNPFKTTATANPFTDDAKESSSSFDGKYATIGRSNPFSSSSSPSNPFLDDKENEGGKGKNGNAEDKNSAADPTPTLLPETTKTLNKIVSASFCLSVVCLFLYVH